MIGCDAPPSPPTPPGDRVTGPHQTTRPMSGRHGSVMNQRTLVTGGAGFIGSHLVDLLHDILRAVAPEEVDVRVLRADVLRGR